MSREGEDFLTQCTECGACREACPFLERCGLPGEIIVNSPEDVFLCTNCGACDLLCPSGLSPLKALRGARLRLTEEGGIGEKAAKTLASMRGFVTTSHGFLFRHYATSPVLFWPGCGLVAASPRTVRRVRGLLEEHLGIKVGLALDCCGDPLNQAGDTEGSSSTIRMVEEWVRKAGATRIVTGCVNCQKLLSAALKGVAVDHVLSVLPLNAVLKDEGNGVYLHHPCPASPMEEVKEGARRALSLSASGILESDLPMCCGHGGGLTGTDRELSDKFLDRLTEKGQGKRVVTYCMGCAGRFLERGVRVDHLLDLATGREGLYAAPGPLGGWARRCRLAMAERFCHGRLFLALALAAIIGALAWLRLGGYFQFEDIVVFLREHRILAPIVFILVYTVAPALFLPAIPLSLAAGFLWGPVWGVVLSIIGATLGASVSFVIARYLMGDAVRARLGRGKWDKFMKVVEKHGWKAVAIARLVPVLPFNMLNYFFGITPIPFSHYLWCTFVFMLPGCVAFVAFGNSMGDMVKGDVKGLVVGLVIALAAFLLPVAFRPLMRKMAGREFLDKGAGKPGGDPKNQSLTKD